ncbi:MAG: hypothetical protein II695_05795, partial [Oscillospiraceae bacterium]|nr:hypothetical protein [Oscillospiraceae bacterium]
SAWNYKPLNKVEVSDDSEENFYQGIYYADIPVRTYDSMTDFYEHPYTASYEEGSVWFPEGQTKYRIYYYNGELILPNYSSDGEDYLGYVLKSDIDNNNTTMYYNNIGDDRQRPITVEDISDIYCIIFFSLP